MNKMTTIEQRAMARISTEAGNMLIVAADQRNSMKAVVADAPSGTDAISTSELGQIKGDLVKYLANEAPAVLLDPEVALPQIPDEGIIDKNTALVVGMDASGYETVDGLRFTRFVEGMSVKRAREFGADAIKMLWYVRPDRQDENSRVATEIRDLVAECERAGVLLIVELLTYQLEGETDEEYASAFGSLVAEGARLAVKCGSKVLKLQYPGSAEGCRLVEEASQGVPWAVLSAGVEHDTFVQQLAIAMENGAAGAMAGRALWKDSLSYDADKRRDLLTTRALPRLRDLEEVVDR